MIAKTTAREGTTLVSETCMKNMYIILYILCMMNQLEKLEAEKAA